jgi:succinyl-diaminopimelate desuccinylase
MSSYDNIKDRVLSNISEDDLIEVSRRLIRVPSETGHEKEVSTLCQQMMKDLGMVVQAVAHPQTPDSPNAIGVWEGVGSGPTIQYSGHLDTVGIGDRSKWITDPYGGEVIEGKLYGRGSMDSKGGGIASVIVAIQAIQKAGIRLKGDVILVGTVYEEVGGNFGMKHVVESGVVDPDLYIYCVHSDLEIKAHFKGVLWTKWTVRGQTAHGSMPQHGVNAITRASRIIGEIDRRKGAHYVRHPILGDHTYNFGWITGGGQNPRYNMVADSCQFGVDMRLVPGQSTKGVVAELQEMLDDMTSKDNQLDARFEVIQGDEPNSVSEDEEALKLVRNCATEIMGRSPAIGGTIAAGDLAAVFAKGRKGVGFGPGDLEKGNAHKENEFIEIKQLMQATQIYALTMLQGCGVD